MKSLSLETALPSSAIVMRPVAAFCGTVVVMAVSEVTWNCAAMVSNRSDLAAVKPRPVIVTVVPMGPCSGRKRSMTIVNGGV